MAIDVKTIIADALLELCKQKPLPKVTVGDIQEKSGVSRQTFYNHFKDKRDLIQYIYESRVIPHWNTPSDTNLDYYSAKLSVLKSDEKYHYFLKQACKMTGANCLTDFMYEHSRRFDRLWHQALYGNDPLPPELCFISDYHSAAGMYMRIRWIMEDMPTPPEEMAEFFALSRLVSLGDLLFQENDTENPYLSTFKKRSSSCLPIKFSHTGGEKT